MAFHIYQNNESLNAQQIHKPTYFPDSLDEILAATGTTDGPSSQK